MGLYQDNIAMASQGNKIAQYNVGVAYFNGNGIAKNDVQAASWFRKAADLGVADAQYNLGLMYNQGRGVEKSVKQATEWFQKAAAQGHQQAQQKLAQAKAREPKDRTKLHLLFNLRTMEKDFVQAFPWAAGINIKNPQIPLPQAHENLMGTDQVLRPEVQYNTMVLILLRLNIINKLVGDDGSKIEDNYRAVDKLIHEMDTLAKLLEESEIDENALSHIIHRNLEYCIESDRQISSRLHLAPSPLAGKVLPWSKPATLTQSVITRTVTNIQYKVLYDYTAQTQHELSIKAGDILDRLLEQDSSWEAKGWIHCKKGNLYGYVAKSFLQEVASQSAAVVITQYKVLYDYAAKSQQELSIKVGDVIEKLLEQNSVWEAKGWVYCKKGNLYGYVGKDFLQEISAQNAATVATIRPTAMDAQTTTIAATSSNSRVPLPTISSLSTIVQQAKQVSVDDKDLTMVLTQRIEEEATRISQQTSADCQILLNNLKQDMQQQLQINAQQRQQQQQEIERLEKELSKTYGAAHVQLKVRINGLEQNQNLLMQEYRTQEANLAQRQHILNQPQMARFYRTVQNKLQQLFLAYKVIGSGLVVSNALTMSEKVVQAISLAGESIPLPGSQAIAFWVGNAVKAGAWLFDKNNESNTNNRVENITQQTLSFQELDTLTETTARQLTLMYQEQLGHITTDSAGLLAEAAVKLMVGYLWAGEFTTMPLYEQLVKSVAQVYQETHVKEFWQRLKQKSKDLQNAFNDTKIPTAKVGENWTAFGVFQRPGLEISATPNNHYYSGGATQPEIYGYRLSTQQEVESCALQRTPERVASRVLAAKKLVPGSEQQLDKIGKDTKILKNDTELLRAQLQQEQAARIALEKRIEERFAQGNTSASVSPMASQYANILKPLVTMEITTKIIFIENNTLSIDRTEIAADKLSQVNQLLEAYADNCKESDVKRNRNQHITALTLSTVQLVDKLKEKLLEALGLSHNIVNTCKK